MAGLIVKSPYLKCGEDHSVSGYLHYIGTRERVELLPYHVLGVHKYKALNIPYPLEGVEPMEPQKLSNWQTLMNNHLNES